MSVIDLSALKDSKKNAGPSIDTVSDEELEALEKMAEDNPEPEGEPVRTAFLVVINKDGTTIATPDLDVALVREHLPNTDEIFAACQIISKDITVQESAMGTAQFMQQMAMAQMQARQNANLAQNLDLKGGPKR